MSRPEPAAGPGRLIETRAIPTLRLLLHPLAASTLLVVGVAAGRLSLVILATPFVVSSAVGLATFRLHGVGTDLTIERSVAVEGDETEAHLTVTSDTSVPITARLESPPGLTFDPATFSGMAPLTVDIALRAERWGLHSGPGAVIDCEDDFGFLLSRSRWSYPTRVEVHPAVERLRRSIPARWVGRVTGAHPSRQRADGIEFAEPRPYVPGDPWRSLNWRITRRRGTPWINQRHPERAADVLLFLDSFGEAVGERETTLTMAVQAALSLSRRHLGATDRVGMVDLGGVLRWVEPRAGTRQLYRITETLLGSDLILTYADKDLDVIPVRGLPPRSLVIALTPLADRRAIGALFDLRARGYDLSVIECEGETRAAGPHPGLEQLAVRLQTLERDATRDRLRALGVPVARWRPNEPVDAAIERVLRYRRRPSRRAA